MAVARGAVLFFGAALSFFMEVALPTFSPLLIVTGRMGLAALVLNGALLWQEKAPVRTQYFIAIALAKMRWTKPAKQSAALWPNCMGAATH